MDHIYIMTENGLSLIKTNTSIWEILGLITSAIAIITSSYISLSLFRKDKFVSQRARISIDEIDNLGLRLEVLNSNNKQVRILETKNYENINEYFKDAYKSTTNIFEQYKVKREYLNNSKFIKIENIGPGNVHNCSITVDVEVNYLNTNTVEIVRIDSFLPLLKEHEDCFMLCTVLPPEELKLKEVNINNKHATLTFDHKRPETYQRVKKINLTYNTIYNEKITLINEYNENLFIYKGFCETKHFIPIINKTFSGKKTVLYNHLIEGKKITWFYPYLSISNNEIMDTIHI